MKFLFLLRQLEINNSPILRRIFVRLGFCCEGRIAGYATTTTKSKADKKARKVGGLFVSSCLSTFFLFSCSAQQNTAPETENFSGKQLTFARNKGNCLACHAIEDGEFPGNIGPPLKAIQKRFKSKQQLHQQIWDATLFNPETSMPPFGKNKILTEQEIDRIVDYLWRL